MYWISSINTVWPIWYGTGPFFFPWVLIWTALFLGLWLFAFFVFFRWRARWACGNVCYGHYRVGPSGTPEEILRIRLAKGDISHDEYEELLRRIGKN